MTNDEIAERLMKRRANALFALSIAFIIMQGSFIDRSAQDGPLSPLMIGAWAAMAVIMLFFFATGGGWAHPRGVRALMNDESTQLHRARATTIAFYNMMATGVILYGLGMIKPVTGGQAVHLMMTVGIASALMAFAGWERIALRTAR